MTQPTGGSQNASDPSTRIRLSYQHLPACQTADAAAWCYSCQSWLRQQWSDAAEAADPDEQHLQESARRLRAVYWRGLGHPVRADADPSPESLAAWVDVAFLARRLP